MKHTLLALSLMLVTGCKEVRVNPKQGFGSVIDLYELTTNCPASGKSELELRIKDVTEDRKIYREGGIYPYTSADGVCKNINAKEESDILYVVDVTPANTVQKYSIMLDGKEIHSGWPYSEEKGSYPYLEMDLLPPMEKGRHVLSAEIFYKGGKSVKKSLEILVD